MKGQAQEVIDDGNTGIEEILQQKQNPHRYRHTIGVRYTSICLAMCYGEDLTRASYAGLLHDCATYVNEKTFGQMLRTSFDSFCEVEEKNPFCCMEESERGWLSISMASQIRRSLVLSVAYNRKTGYDTFGENRFYSRLY